MARVELNIVALGDFTSVNTQIKALQAQVDLLNKGVAGVGLGSNLTKDLNSASAAFKNTMLSTGQFTQSQVQLTTETQKFGKALESGKLSLGTYYNIIKQNSGTAMNSVKALAVEQTKLQNSVIMADPTKQGFYSVFTPTTINKISDATKIAANEQNIYNIAVEKGTQSLINWGKNTQWAGRQLTVGMSVPLMLFAGQATAAFKDVNIELTRLQRLYGEGLTPPSQAQINQISSQVVDLGKQVASSMGIAVKDTVQVAANFAAMGRQGQNLLDTTYQAQRLSKLGAVDATAATNTIVALQNVYKVSTNDLANAVNFLSDIQKQTTMTLGDMTQAIPRVGPIMEQLGGTYKDTAVMLVAMREAGIPAAQAANAVKSAVASMIAPTKAASQEWQKYGVNLAAIKDNTQGNPVQMIEALQAGLSKLSPLVKEQLIEKLFGKFQFARVSALLDNFGKIGSQTQNALKIAGASAGELATLANQEMTQATSSPTAKYQRALETFKAELIPVGQKIIEITTTLMNFGNTVAKIFSGLPGPIKSILGIAAIGTILAGPIIMLTGLMANFIGYITKAVFNLKQLATGGTTLRQLLTPQIIASQQAADLFSKGILGDVDSVDLLNQAIKNLTISMEGLVSSMTATTGISSMTEAVSALDAVAVAETGVPAALRSVPFKAPGMATGGFVPGSGNTDSFPAMLMPGEAVVPKEEAKKWQPFLSAMISGNLRGYAKGIAGRGNSGRTGKSSYTLSESYGTNVAQGENSVSFGRIDPSLANLSDIYAPHIMAQSGTNVNQINKEIDNWKKENAEAIKKATQAWQNGASETEAFSELTAKFKKDMESANGPVHKFITTAKRLAPELEKDFKEAQLYASKYSLDMKNASHVAQMAKDLPNNILAQGINTSGNFQRYAKTRAASTAILKGSESYEATGVPRFMTTGITSDSDKTYYNKLMSQGHFSRNTIHEENLAKQQAIRSSKNEEEIAKQLNEASQSSSPSKVTKGAAKNMVDGVVKGIKEGKPEVQSAAHDAWIPQEGETVEKSGAPNSSRMSRLKGLVTNESGKMNIQSKMALSGGLMMGGSMLAGMLPKDSNAANITQSVSSMAGMGAMFGPYGVAAGAALGLITGGLGALMKAEKEHAAVVASTFSASSADIQMFGNKALDATKIMQGFSLESNKTASTIKSTIDPAMQKYIADFKALSSSDSTSIFIKNLATLNNSSDIINKVQVKVATAVANGLDPKNAKAYTQALLIAAGQTRLFGQAWATIGPSVKDNASATKEQFLALGDAIMYSRNQENASAVGYKDLNTEQKAAADSLRTLFVAAGTGQITFSDLQARVKALGEAGFNTADAVNMLEDAILKSGNKDEIANFNAIKKVFKDAGDEASLTTGKVLGMIAAMNAGATDDTVKKWAASQPSLKGASLATDWEAYVKSPENKKSMDAAAKIQAQMLADSNKAAGLNADGTTKTVSTTDPITLLTKKYADLVKLDNKRISDLEKTNKLMNDQNQAAKDAVDLATQQTDLQNQIRQAMASGDYLKANLLRQNMASNQDTFNQKIITNKNQTTVDTLKQNLADFQDQISQGIDPGSKAAAALKSGVLGANIQTYQAGSVTMPSAVQYGSSAQMGTSPNSMPQINVVVNANGLTIDQARVVATNAVSDALTKAGITAGASSRLKSVGG